MQTQNEKNVGKFYYMKMEKFRFWKDTDSPFTWVQSAVNSFHEALMSARRCFSSRISVWLLLRPSLSAHAVRRPAFWNSTVWKSGSSVRRLCVSPPSDALLRPPYPLACLLTFDCAPAIFPKNYRNDVLATAVHSSSIEHFCLFLPHVWGLW